MEAKRNDTCGITQMDLKENVQEDDEIEGRWAASLVLPAGDTSYEVHIGSADPLSLVPKLVSEKHDEEERYWEVVGNKRRCVPFSLEENLPVGE